MTKRKRNRPDKDGADRVKFKHYKERMKAMQLPCAICGLPINYELPYTSPWSFTADHIIPISKGGGTTMENLQPAHRKCNRAKGEKMYMSPNEILKLRLAQGHKGVMQPNDISMADSSTGQGMECSLYDARFTQEQRGLPQSQNWRTY